MKISAFNSTLSCIAKCIRFVVIMINKKIILGLFAISFLGACASPTAMLAPAYTLSSSGNVLQAGLSYGSNEIITMYTGKTPLENLQELSAAEKEKANNIQKNTLESEDFSILVKNRIKNTRNILNN